MTENKNIEEFPEKPFNLAKEVFEWFYTILIALAIAFIIKGFFYPPQQRQINRKKNRL